MPMPPRFSVSMPTKMVNYFRASFIKAYLCRNKHEEKDMTTLNRITDCP